MARRTTPPTPAVTLHAPAHYIESVAERDDRVRQQKLNDDDFKKRDGKFDEYKDKLAIDYPKATAAHYHFLARAIITDLDRWIENLSPGTTDVAVQYRAMVKRLLDRWGPTSEKDAEESRRKFASIAVDTYGADVFLAAADTIVDNLAKTLPRTTQLWNQYPSVRIWPDPHGTLPARTSPPTSRPTKRHKQPGNSNTQPTAR